MNTTTPTPAEPEAIGWPERRPVVVANPELPAGAPDVPRLEPPEEAQLPQGTVFSWVLCGFLSTGLG